MQLKLNDFVLTLFETFLCYFIGKSLNTTICYYLLKCLFERVSCDSWLGMRVCNCAVARRLRPSIAVWFKAEPTHIQVALTFLSVLNKIYL